MLRVTRIALIAIACIGCNVARPGADAPASESAASPALSPAMSEAAAACNNLDTSKVLPMPRGTTVVAAFKTDDDSLNRWRSRLIAQSGVEPPDMPTSSADDGTGRAFVCYFDGDFGRPRGNLPDSFPNYNRIVVAILTNGTPDIVAMGYRDQLGVLDPNDETATPLP
jgi:hypothetical protein